MAKIQVKIYINRQQQCAIDIQCSQKRSSADADKPAQPVRTVSQSRSPNIVLFDMLGMVSY